MSESKDDLSEALIAKIINLVSLTDLNTGDVLLVGRLDWLAGIAPQISVFIWQTFVGSEV